MIINLTICWLFEMLAKLKTLARLSKNRDNKNNQNQKYKRGHQ